MSNMAQDVIWPRDGNILVRVVFLYVGQGDSTIVLAADGASYRTLLVDINIDAERGGIDVPRLMKDLLGDVQLAAFVNTHPHSDHLHGVVELSDAVGIAEVWHSGHVPGKAHADAYANLQEVIATVKKAGGKEVRLEGSRTSQVLGNAECHILAPASYVVDDIEGETAEARYRRIHEQCAVLKVGKDPTWCMLAGDADRDAWEKHITDYHRERLPSRVLGAAHHGSRTFFRYTEEDDPYLDALKAIAPDYVVLSAPKREESPHEHPHADAIGYYEAQVGAGNVLHGGPERYSYICDIYRDGSYGGVVDDKAKLAKAYPAGEGNDDGDEIIGAPAIVSGTRVDDRPQGDA